MATVNVDDQIEGGDTNDTEALQRTAAIINAANGGTIEFANRTYTVGKQSFEAGVGYTSEQNLFIQDCTDPVIINGNGAVITSAAGQRYGSFDIDTGDPIAPSAPYTGTGKTDIKSTIKIFQCASVTVNDLDMNGNITNMIIGGVWGDSGRQIEHDGLHLAANDSVEVRNVNSDYCGRDGCYVWGDVYDGTEPTYPHFFYDSNFTYNGRQGMSWTGGNHLYAESCTFNYTGQNGSVWSSPAAGLDVEPEGVPSRIARNGEFIGCTFAYNGGVGALAVAGDSADVLFWKCTFIGTLDWSVWPDMPRYQFIDCDFNGAIVNSYEDAADPTQACQYINCTLRMEGTTYGVYHDVSNSDNVLFDNCLFQSDSTHQLPWSIATTLYNNCLFSQDGGSPTAYPRGVYTGTSFMIDPSETVSTFGSTFSGPFYYNGVNIGVDEPITGPVTTLDPYGKRT